MNLLKEKWGAEKRYYLPTLGDDKEFGDLFQKRFEKYNKENNKDEAGLYYDTLDNCVEIILSKDKERGFVLNPILQCLDSKTLQVVESQVFEFYGFENDDDLKLHIAMAMANEVPVYGNNKTIQKKLDKIQKDIIVGGIKENEQTYALTIYKDFDMSNHTEILKRLNQSSYVTKAEIGLLNDSVSSKFKEYTNAADFLERIESVIKEFSNLLNSEKRNENKIQEFITANPIILGTEYKKIIPKHKLGSEFEMDYALQRFDGVFDLVEIESSNLPLFNKNGQPSHFLVHAEQQVLDWQDWLEEKNYYAREKLENINSPTGIIVIGTNKNTDLKKLRRRNISYSNLNIYTYDQLLEKLITLNTNIKKGKK